MRLELGIQKACAWSGYAVLAIFLIGFWPVAGFVPPPSPGHSPDVTAAFFRHHTELIRLGLILTMFGATLIISWAAAITAQMRRIEGARTLAQIQLMSAALLVVAFMIPVFAWQAIAYRHNINPGTAESLNDFAWLCFLGWDAGAMLQAFVIGIAIIRDPADEPIFPRWLGYANLWMVVLFAPSAVIPFFKAGPLAWNGIIAWWLVLAAFGIWILLMTAMTVRAISRQQAELPDGERVPA